MSASSGASERVRERAGSRSLRGSASVSEGCHLPVSVFAALLFI